MTRVCKKVICDMHMGKMPCEHEDRDQRCIYKLRAAKGCQQTISRWREGENRLSLTVFRKSQIADILISKFQPPDLWNNTFLLLKPPSLWYFVTEALATYCPTQRNHSGGTYPAHIHIHLCIIMCIYIYMQIFSII